MYSTPAAHETAFTSWQDHTSAAKIDTDNFVHTLLRKAYPETHIVRTTPSKCDLIGFANAGHAKAVSVVWDGFDALRVYKAPPSRLDSAFGRLENVVNFGLWNYKFETRNFRVYEVSYLDRFSRIAKLLYILCPVLESHSHNVVVDHLLKHAGRWTAEAHDEVWVFDSARWSKNKELWASVQQSSWEDVIVSPEVRKKLSQDVDDFFDSRDSYEKFRIPWKRGIIFHGVPGVGKTLFIKMLMKSVAARPTPVPTLYVKSLDSCAGPKWSIQQIFKKARRQAPCLLVFEDLDSLVSDGARSYFLNEVDGLNNNDGILMIGSTNYLDQLDPAVTKRPSRFDRKYHFELPTEQERLAYCHYWRHKMPDADEVGFSEEMCTVVARLRDGFSFAYLKELFVGSLLLIAGGEPDGVMDDNLGQTTDAEDMDTDSALPSVDIPDSVRDSKLFSTLEPQIRELLQDMKHVGDSTGPKPGDSRPPPPIYRMQSMLDDSD